MGTHSSTLYLSHAASNDVNAQRQAGTNDMKCNDHPCKASEKSVNVLRAFASTGADKVPAKPPGLVQMGLLNSFRKGVARQSGLAGACREEVGRSDVRGQKARMMEDGVVAETCVKSGIGVSDNTGEGEDARKQQCRCQHPREMPTGQGVPFVQTCPQSGRAALHRFELIWPSAPIAAAAIETAAAPKVTASISKDRGGATASVAEVNCKQRNASKAFPVLTRSKQWAIDSIGMAIDQSIPDKQKICIRARQNAFNVLMGSESPALLNGREIFDNQVHDNEVPRKCEAQSLGESAGGAGLAKDTTYKVARDERTNQILAAPTQPEISSGKSNAPTTMLMVDKATPGDDGQLAKKVTPTAKLEALFHVPLSKYVKRFKGRALRGKLRGDLMGSQVGESAAMNAKQADVMPTAEAKAKVGMNKVRAASSKPRALEPQSSTIACGDAIQNSSDTISWQSSQARQGAPFVGAVTYASENSPALQERDPSSIPDGLRKPRQAHLLVARSVESNLKFPNENTEVTGVLKLVEDVTALPVLVNEGTSPRSPRQPQSNALRRALTKARMNIRPEHHEVVGTKNAMEESAILRIKRMLEDTVDADADFFFTPSEKKMRKEEMRRINELAQHVAVEEQRRVNARQIGFRKAEGTKRTTKVVVERAAVAKRCQGETRERWIAQQKQAQEDVAAIDYGREVASIFHASSVLGESAQACSWLKLRARDIDDELLSSGSCIGSVALSAQIPVWLEDWPWSVPGVAKHQPLPQIPDELSPEAPLEKRHQDSLGRATSPLGTSCCPAGSLPLHLDLANKCEFPAAKVILTRDLPQMHPSMRICAAEAEIAERARWRDMLMKRFARYDRLADDVDPFRGRLVCGPEWGAQLWSELLRPLSCAELCGNALAASQLRCWLLRWADTQAEKHQRMAADSIDCKLNDIPRNSEDAQARPHVKGGKLIVVKGPSGAGKKAAVYACAAELGFKVIEVHTGMRRAGKQILSQFAEATQSHELGKWSSSALNDLSAEGGCFSKVRQEQPSMQGPSAGAVRRSHMRADEEKGAKVIGRTRSAIFDSKCSAYTPAVALEASKSGRPAKERATTATNMGAEAVERTLVLFEAAEHVFEEDVGFYAALRRLAKTSKCPIVATVNRLPREFQEETQCLQWCRPKVQELLPYMEALCEAQGVSAPRQQLNLLLQCMACDMRKVLHALQCLATVSTQVGQSGCFDDQRAQLVAIQGFGHLGAPSLVQQLLPPPGPTSTRRQVGIVATASAISSTLVEASESPAVFHTTFPLHLHSSTSMLLQQLDQHFPLLDHLLRLLDAALGGRLLGDAHLSAQLFLGEVPNVVSQAEGLKEAATARKESEEGAICKRQRCLGMSRAKCRNVQKRGCYRVLDDNDDHAMTTVPACVDAAPPPPLVALELSIVARGVAAVLTAALRAKPSAIGLVPIVQEKPVPLDWAKIATGSSRVVSQAHLRSMDSAAELYESLSSIPQMLQAAHPADPSSCWGDVLLTPSCTSYNLASTQQMLGLSCAAAVVRGEASDTLSNNDDASDGGSINGRVHGGSDESQRKSAAGSQLYEDLPQSLLLLPNDTAMVFVKAQEHRASLGRALDNVSICAPILACGIGQSGSRLAQLDYHATLRSICLVETSRKVF